MLTTISIIFLSIACVILSIVLHYLSSRLNRIEDKLDQFQEKFEYLKFYILTLQKTLNEQSEKNNRDCNFNLVCDSSIYQKEEYNK